MSTEKLTHRQRRLADHYASNHCSIFGANDYTLVAPSSSSLLLSDENFTVAYKLFGDDFDRKLRSFVIVSWFPGLLLQLVCFPIGLLTLTGRLKPAMAISTFPGALFPVLLLLRSHWTVFQALIQKWEPVFLAIYSFIFCISISYIVMFDLRLIFIWMVIFPALLASTFADASAVRLDYAFLKGQLSTATLIMPPYVVSLAYVFSIIVLTNVCPPRNVVNVETTHVMSNIISSNINCSYIAASTGSTICLFICKSVALLFINPRRCNSLSSSMTIDTITLKKRIRPERARVSRHGSMVREIYHALRTGSINMIARQSGIGSKSLGLLGNPGQHVQKSILDEGDCANSLQVFESARENAVKHISTADRAFAKEGIHVDHCESYKRDGFDDDKYYSDSDSYILEVRFNLFGLIGLEPVGRRVLSPPTLAEAPVLNLALQSTLTPTPNQHFSKRSRKSKLNKFSRVSPLECDTGHNSLSDTMEEMESQGIQIGRDEGIAGSLGRSDLEAVLQRLKLMQAEGGDQNFSETSQSTSFEVRSLSTGIIATDECDDESKTHSYKYMGRMTLDNNAAVEGRNHRVGESLRYHQLYKGLSPIVPCTSTYDDHGSSKLANSRFSDKSNDNISTSTSRVDCKKKNHSIERDYDDNGIDHPSRLNPLTNLCTNSDLDHKIDINDIDRDRVLFTERQKRLLPYYEAAKAELFGPHQYTLLAPVPSFIVVSDESATVAYHLFGEKFDNILRLSARYLWYPALFLQICCLPIGLLTLLGLLPNYVAVITALAVIFPFIILMQCHWKIFCLLLYNWEQIFLTFFSAFFCVTLTLILQGDIRSVYIWLAVFPALFASVFSDASATRLDYVFLVKKDSSTLFQSIFYRALPPYLASLMYTLSIVAILNLDVPLSFDLFATLPIHTTVLSTDINYSVTSSSTGFTVCLFLTKYVFSLIREPMTCVSLRSPMVIGIAHLKPQPDDPVERANGHYVFQSKFTSQIQKPKMISYFSKWFGEKEGDIKSDEIEESSEVIINYCPMQPAEGEVTLRLGASGKPEIIRRLSQIGRKLSGVSKSFTTNRRHSESNLTRLRSSSTKPMAATFASTRQSCENRENLVVNNLLRLHS